MDRRPDAAAAPPSSFQIHVDFLHRKYDAARAEGGDAEWPPHPYRLFGALRSAAAALRIIHGAEAEARALAVLRKFERCPAPVVWAPAAELQRHATFVPVIPDGRSAKNAPIDVGKHDNRTKANAYPDISTSRGKKFLQAAIPLAPTVVFDIPRGELDAGDFEVLDELLMEIPYLGRSTSPALLRRTETWTPAPGLREYRPGAGHLVLHSWRPGTLDGLEQKWVALTQVRPMGGRVGGQAVNYLQSENWEKLRWMAFEPRDAMPYRALRGAKQDMQGLRRSLPDSAVPILLANVGNKYANGRLGLAVHVPDEPALLVEVGQALLSRGWQPAGSGRWLSLSHWTRLAQIFATATPVWDTEQDAGTFRGKIERQLAGWGEIEELAVSRHPMLAGGESLRVRDAWHVAVKFSAALSESRSPRTLQDGHGLLLPLGPSHSGGERS
ncbi:MULTISPECIES: type I-U CRISPR-associated protein Csb2 [Arthrobacter]|uniref:Type I-U CRISPR-associated protein Csb2 n=2 Tax=Arthrobacter TaxID=1663 RepID=A0ABU9KM27_9MICC|nr:type I-U CRISPR-associated protein Csb2 [Arthrobacter sp. YJM1]MDP5228473.1 type I-U CRISPR-associated protein Csb2 [Arthrobacter sp. YJM1]